jgi:hypothetical protein
MAVAFDYEIMGPFYSHPVGLAEPGKSDIYYAVDDSLMLIFDVLGKTCGLWLIQRKTAKSI